MAERILIVEDEEKIARFIELELKHEGYEVSKCANGREGLAEAQKGSYDLMLLDIMLPELNGFEVLRRLRRTSALPVILLTARDAVMDKVAGLDGGADDYITKPFSPREIVYRIKAQLRRQQYQSVMRTDVKGLLTVGGLALDRESSRIYKNEKEIDLTGREFLLLSYLMENADKIISKERLYEQVWGEYSSICDNTIMVHIRHIREKIEDTPSTPKQLITIKGLGYKLKKRTD